MIYAKPAPVSEAQARYLAARRAELFARTGTSVPEVPKPLGEALPSVPAPPTPDPIDASQGGFDDPAWRNPGRSDSERFFWERKRREYFAAKGDLAPAMWAKPVAAFLPGIEPPKGRGGGKAIPATRPPRGYRRKGDPKYTRDADLKQSVDRNMIAKVLFIAEQIERKTKAKGCRNGVLGQTGIVILRALIKVAKHYNGTCFPSYAKIQELTGLALQTIADALERLKLAGFLTIINRIVKVQRVVENPMTGRPMTVIATEQTSNAYLFRLPALAAAALGMAWQELARSGLAPDAQPFLGQAANSTEQRANPTKLNLEDREVALSTLKLRVGAYRMAA